MPAALLRNALARGLWQVGDLLHVAARRLEVAGPAPAAEPPDTTGDPVDTAGDPFDTAGDPADAMPDPTVVTPNPTVVTPEPAVPAPVPAIVTPGPAAGDGPDSDWLDRIRTSPPPAHWQRLLDGRDPRQVHGGTPGAPQGRHSPGPADDPVPASPVAPATAMAPVTALAPAVAPAPTAPAVPTITTVPAAQPTTEPVRAGRATPTPAAASVVARDAGSPAAAAHTLPEPAYPYPSVTGQPAHLVPEPAPPPHPPDLRARGAGPTPAAAPAPASAVVVVPEAPAGPPAPPWHEPPALPAERWPSLPDDTTLWTPEWPDPASDRVARLDEEQRGLPWSG